MTIDLFFKGCMRGAPTALLVATVSLGAYAQGGAPNSTTSAGRGPAVVSGVVPDEATRQTILRRAREVYGDRVVDQLGVAPASAPPAWADQVTKMMTPELRSVRQGHLRVVGTAVEIVGQVESVQLKNKIGAALVENLNPTYGVDNQLNLFTAPQAQIDNALAGKIVEFEFSSSVLTPAGRRVLDDLLPILKGLNGKSLQIIGHTDAAGARSSNLLLSQERANAVRDYLRVRGISAGDMTVVGVGPDQPIASNATAEGQAKNRRIEFKISP